MEKKGKEKKICYAKVNAQIYQRILNRKKLSLKLLKKKYRQNKFIYNKLISLFLKKTYRISDSDKVKRNTQIKYPEQISKKKEYI